MGNPEHKAQPFLLGQKELYSLLAIRTALEEETSMRPTAYRPISLDTIYKHELVPQSGGKHIQTISNLKMIPDGPDGYTLQLLHQQISAPNASALPPRDYWKDKELISWRKKSLRVPSRGMSAHIQITEESYDTDLGKDRKKATFSYTLNGEEAPWLNNITQRVLGALRDRIVDHSPDLFTQAPQTYQQISAFVAEFGEARVRELSQTPDRPVVGVVETLIADNTHALLFPRVTILSEYKEARGEAHLVLTRSLFDINPSLLHVDVPAGPIAGTTSQEEQQEVLLGIADGIDKELSINPQLYNEAFEMAQEYEEVFPTLYPNDLSVTGSVQRVHVYFDPKREPTFLVESTVRELIEGSKVQLLLSQPWQNPLPTSETARLLLSLLHKPELSDIIV